jgi:signal transduction histidine kinase
MKLHGKLFFSYIVVALIGLAVLVTSTALVAPANFSRQMHMRGPGQGAGQGMMQQRMAVLDAELEASFRESVINALALAGIAAVLAAGAISWLVSNRIVSPLQALADLSRRIAGGHYEQRLHLDTNDELAELVESFNQMAASLAETETMRQQLLGDVTHELNTPLASIKGYMEGLQDGVLPATPETFQLVHREAARLQRLVQDLQQLSQAEAGQMELHINACDPHEIITPVVERMRPQFQDKGIALRAALPDDLPTVRADSDRAAQVLTNLLGNALQYTPAGGEVTVAAAGEDQHVRFTVADTGVGLAPDDLERIFQRFYRVDKSRSRASGGSGIGLTVARHLVAAQGGALHAESAGTGQGSRFVFTLPLA